MTEVSSESVRWAYRLFLGRQPLRGEVEDMMARFVRLDRMTHHFLQVAQEFGASERGRLLSASEYQAAAIPRRSAWGLGRLGGRPAGVSRDTILWAYRLFLGREPESEWVIGEKLKAADEIELLRSFYHSEEFADRSRDWPEDFAPVASGGVPLPPLKLRRAVGPTDRVHWDNPDGSPVFGDEVPERSYRSVLDFGCGCGRAARLMLQQRTRPEELVGIDLNRESIEWCREHLSAMAPAFTFMHLDTYNARFNPSGQRLHLPLPLDRRFSLVNAHSVFTHIVESGARHYVTECARLLEDHGVFRATWFVFDKTAFPMMQEAQNSLYINSEDPTNAVIYDYHFVESLYRDAGLVMVRIIPPAVQGFHWVVIAQRREGDATSMRFPADLADKGVVRPPLA